MKGYMPFFHMKKENFRILETAFGNASKKLFVSVAFLSQNAEKHTEMASQTF